MLFGEEIFLIGLGGLMFKMCRIKYFEQYIVFIKSFIDEEIENMLFVNLKDMFVKLEVFVEIEDEKIGYVDIYMLVFMLYVCIFEKKKLFNC